MLWIRKAIPLYIYHGRDDDVVPVKNAELSYQYIKNDIYGDEFK